MSRLDLRLREPQMLITEEQLLRDRLQVSIPRCERVGYLEEVQHVLQSLPERLGRKGLVALEDNPLQVVILTNARGEEFHEGPVPLFRGDGLGCPARFVTRAEVSIPAQQQLGHLFVALRGGGVQRGGLLAVFGIHVGVLLQQQGDQFAMPLARRHVQRRFAGGVLGVYVRLAGQQHFSHLAVPVVHGHVERRFLAQSPRVDLRLAIQQQPGDRRMPVQGRQVQRRAAVFGPRGGQLRIGLQQRLDLLNIAGTDGVEYVRARDSPVAHHHRLNYRRKDGY